MKNLDKMKYIYLLFLGIFFISCNDDFLVREPLDNPSDEQFLSNQIELELAVTGVYNSLWYHPPEVGSPWRSEEHTSELQSRGHLVCRLLLEKKENRTLLIKDE